MDNEAIPHEQLSTLKAIGLTANADEAVDTNLPEPELLWTWHGLNNGIYGAPKSGPCFSRDALFVGSDRGFLVSLTLSGKERWRYPVRDTERGVHSTPAYSRNRVYFGAYDGYLYCVDATAGNLIWEQRPGDWIGSSPIVNDSLDQVLVGVEYGANHGRLMSFDAATGATIRSTELGAYVHSSPILYAPQGLAIVGCNDGRLYAISASTGKIRWAYQTGSDIKSNAATDAQGRVFVGSFDGFLYALDASTGSLLWRRRLSDNFYLTPFLYNENVIAGGFTGYLTALDRATGALRWSTNLGGRIIGGIAPAGNRTICLGCNSNILYIDAETGEPLRRYKTARPLRINPKTNNQQVIVPTCDGNLHSFATL